MVIVIVLVCVDIVFAAAAAGRPVPGPGRRLPRAGVSSAGLRAVSGGLQKVLAVD